MLILKNVQRIIRPVIGINFIVDTVPVVPIHNHYENTPMQYTAIFHSLKNDNFQMKNCDIFLIFAQNIDCGYTLEPPHVRTASVRRF